MLRRISTVTRRWRTVTSQSSSPLFRLHTTNAVISPYISGINNIQFKKLQTEAVRYSHRTAYYIHNNSSSSRANSHRRREYATYRRFNNQESSWSHSSNWNKQIQWGGATLVLGGILYLTHLESAPYSNRSRFMIIGAQLEKFVGDQGYQQTLSEFRNNILPEGHPDVAKVKRVMSRIIKVSGLEDLDWRIHVINDPRSPPNAFVLPGGKVFVFSSILPICGDEDGLATVLSHETAHQVARHTAENLSKAPIYIALGLLLYTVTGSASLNRILISGLLKLPASREMEREADYIGLMMMSKACFDPSQAVHLWERMSKFEEVMTSRVNGGGGMVPEFLSTHPSSRNRIEFIRKALPEAQTMREQAGCNDRVSKMLPSFREWSLDSGTW